MADASPARDAVRAADDLRHELTVHLEDALIILDVEVARPVPAESAAWIARAQSSLSDALGACDELKAKIAAAQAEVARLARQMPVALDSPLRCPKPKGDSGG